MDAAPNLTDHAVELRWKISPKLSPAAAPFYPTEGRRKALRWADGSPPSVGSAAVVSY